MEKKGRIRKRGVRRFFFRKMAVSSSCRGLWKGKRKPKGKQEEFSGRKSAKTNQLIGPAFCPRTAWPGNSSAEKGEMGEAIVNLG